MEGLLVGLLYIVLYLIVIAIVIYVIIHVCAAVGFPLPAIVVRLLWLALALIGLILLVQLLFGGGVSLPRMTR